MNDGQELRRRQAYSIGDVQVVPTSAALGAEIRGVDLTRRLAAETLDALNHAWAEHEVLLFRDLDLTVEQHLAFAGAFGELEPANLATPLTANHPDLIEISNVDFDTGTAVEHRLGSSEAYWHTDMSYREVPPKASCLLSRELPPDGGDTCFCSMYLAYDAMGDELRAAVEGRTAVHDESRNAAGKLRQGYEDVTDPKLTPGPRHPIIRTHPVTGRKALFLGRRPYAYIPGLSAEESEELLDRLWAHATQARFVWCHRWRLGDMVLWDNRCSMHRRDSFDGKYRRVLHRTQISGDRPY